MPSLIELYAGSISFFLYITLSTKLSTLFNFFIANSSQISEAVQYNDENQLTFGVAYSPFMEGLIELHDDLLLAMTLILVFVSWFLFQLCVRYKSYTNSRYYNASSLKVHDTPLEVIWTIIPAVILVFIAVPTFALLYAMDEEIVPLFTLRVIGHQWYWSYEYGNFLYNNAFIKDTNEGIFESVVNPFRNSHKDLARVYNKFECQHYDMSPRELDSAFYCPRYDSYLSLWNGKSKEELYLTKTGKGIGIINHRNNLLDDVVGADFMDRLTAYLRTELFNKDTQSGDTSIRWHRGDAALFHQADSCSLLKDGTKLHKEAVTNLKRNPMFLDADAGPRPATQVGESPLHFLATLDKDADISNSDFQKMLHNSKATANQAMYIRGRKYTSDFVLFDYANIFYNEVLTSTEHINSFMNAVKNNGVDSTFDGIEKTTIKNFFIRNRNLLNANGDYVGNLRESMHDLKVGLAGPANVYEPDPAIGSKWHYLDRYKPTAIALLDPSYVENESRHDAINNIHISRYQGHLEDTTNIYEEVVNSGNDKYILYTLAKAQLELMGVDIETLDDEAEQRGDYSSVASMYSVFALDPVVGPQGLYDYVSKKVILSLNFLPERASMFKKHDLFVTGLHNQDELFTEFDSYMVPEDELKDYSSLRLLETDTVVFLPTHTHIRVLVTSYDVLHSWCVPALGVKMDAVPGRLNEFNLYISASGHYYGQCSELCGANHGFMPIKIEAVDSDLFKHYALPGVEACTHDNMSDEDSNYIASSLKTVATPERMGSSTARRRIVDSTSHLPVNYTFNPESPILRNLTPNSETLLKAFEFKRYLFQNLVTYYATVKNIPMNRLPHAYPFDHAYWTTAKMPYVEFTSVNNPLKPSSL